MKTPIYYLFLVLFFLAGIVNVFAQQTGLLTANPEELQTFTKTEEATPSIARIDSIFIDLDHDDSPGCAVGVYRAGEVIFAKGYGMAGIEFNNPITSRTVFSIASVSKQFTAMAIVLLTQRGDLSLDDRVRDYIPEIPEYAESVTIRHLIHHTSGLRDNVALLRLARENIEGDGDEIILSMLGWQNTLNFEPGEHYMYNSGGFALLAMIVERVTGTTFREFTDREIFKPLGMVNSGFLGLVTTEGRAFAYEPYGKDKYRLSIPTHSFAGPAGLYTTIEDLAKWDGNFYDMQVGGREGISLMHDPGRLNSGDLTTYAFGLNLQRYRGVPVVMHSGFDPGYTSMMIRFPEQRLTVAVLCNMSSANPWSRAYQVADLNLADHAAADSKPEFDPEQRNDTDVGRIDLERLAGIYASTEGSIVQRIAFEDDILVVTMEGAHFSLIPIGENRFVDGLTHYVLTFRETDREGMNASWSPNPTAQSQEPLRLERIGRHWEPASGELAKFVGSFFSEELDATWKIVEKENSDGFLLRRWGIADQVLEPLMNDTFTFLGSTSPLLQFVRDSDGEITGLIVSNQQILGIEFMRVIKR